MPRLFYFTKKKKPAHMDEDDDDASSGGKKAQKNPNFHYFTMEKQIFIPPQTRALHSIWDVT